MFGRGEPALQQADDMQRLDQFARVGHRAQVLPHFARGPTP